LIKRDILINSGVLLKGDSTKDQIININIRVIMLTLPIKVPTKRLRNLFLIRIDGLEELNNSVFNP